MSSLRNLLCRGKTSIFLHEMNKIIYHAEKHSPIKTVVAVNSVIYVPGVDGGFGFYSFNLEIQNLPSHLLLSSLLSQDKIRN